MELKRELEIYKEIVDNELEKILPSGNLPQNKIFDSMKYSVFAGGKRLRPVLTLKACELVKGDYKEALAFASAIELIHTYSLIHDDLPAIDNDDYRRGKPTNHKVFGENIAILAGDGLLNYAYEIMTKSVLDNINDSKKYVSAFNEIARAAGVFGMIGGQVVDVLSESTSIDEKTLNFIHKNKTSALIEASLVVGGIIGEASADEINSLREYGKAIGLGYQIRDDILDKIGEQEKLGKDIGSDEEKNKATYVSFYGLDGSIKKNEELCEKAINSISIFKNREAYSFFKDFAIYLVNRDM